MEPLGVLTRSLRGVVRRKRREGIVTVASGVGAGLRIGLRDASADYRGGTNEIPVQEAVRDLLSPGATFFDVGSNVGFFALIAARIVGPTGAVHAFEPVPAIAGAIRKNAERNGLSNVQVHSVAVGGRDTRAELMLAAHPGGATLSTADAPDDMTGKLEVPVVTLDRLVAEGLCPAPDVVKIDVEGAEEQVLDGMAELLRVKRPALIMELDSSKAEVLDTKVATWRERMASLDYAITNLDDSYVGSGWHVYHAVARPTPATDVPVSPAG